MTEERKFMQKKSTYAGLLILAALTKDLLNGDVSFASSFTSVGIAIILAYPICYIYQAIRYKRWSVGDKYQFEVLVLQLALILSLLLPAQL